MTKRTKQDDEYDALLENAVALSERNDKLCAEIARLLEQAKEDQAFLTTQAMILKDQYDEIAQLKELKAHQEQMNYKLADQLDIKDAEIARLEELILDEWDHEGCPAPADDGDSFRIEALKIRTKKMEEQ